MADDTDNTAPLTQAYNPETHELRDVTDDQAKRLKAAGFATGQDAIAAHHKNVGQELVAGASGAASGFTLGGSDLVTQYLLPDSARKFVNTANAAHPYIHLGGDIAGSVYGLGKLRMLGKAAGLAKWGLRGLNVGAAATQGAVEAIADDAREGNDVNVEHITSGGIVGGLFGLGGEAVEMGFVQAGKFAKRGGEALIDLAKKRGWIKVNEEATQAAVKKGFTAAKSTFLENRAAEKGLTEAVEDAKLVTRPPAPQRPKPMRETLSVEELATPWDKRPADFGPAPIPLSDIPGEVAALRKSDPLLTDIKNLRRAPMIEEAPFAIPLANEAELAKLPGFPEKGKLADKAEWFETQRNHLDTEYDPSIWGQDKHLDNITGATDTTARMSPELKEKVKARKQYYAATDAKRAEMEAPPKLTADELDIYHNSLAEKNAIKPAKDKFTRLKDLTEEQQKLFTEAANPFDDVAQKRLANKATNVAADKEFTSQLGSLLDQLKKNDVERAAKIESDYASRSKMRGEEYKTEREVLEKDLKAQTAAQLAAEKAADTKAIADFKAKIKADKRWEKSGIKLEKQLDRIRDRQTLKEIYGKIKANTPDVYQADETRNEFLKHVAASSVIGGGSYVASVLANKAGYTDTSRTLRTIGTLAVAHRQYKYMKAGLQRSLADAANNEAVRTAYFESQLRPMLERYGKRVNAFIRVGGAAAINKKMTNEQIDKAYDKLSANTQRLQQSPDLIEQHVAQRLGPLTQENPQLHTTYVAKAAMAVKAMTNAMPKNPLPPSAHNPAYNPPRSKKLEALQSYQAIRDPVGTLTGKPTPAQVSLIKQLYPGIYNDFQTQLTSVVQDGKTQKLPRAKQAQLSRALGGPLRPIDNRQYQMRAQSTFAPPPPQGQQQQQGQAQFSPRALSTIGKTGARVLAPGAQQSEVENAT